MRSAAIYIEVLRMDGTSSWFLYNITSTCLGGTISVRIITMIMVHGYMIYSISISMVGAEAAATSRFENKTAGTRPLECSKRDSASHKPACVLDK